MPFFKLQIIVFFPSSGINDVVVVVVDHANDSHLSSTCKFIHEVLSLMLYKVVTENNFFVYRRSSHSVLAFILTDLPCGWLFSILSI